MSGILFDHIAIAVSRMAAAPAVLVGQLGGTPAHGGSSARYRFGQWRFEGGGRIEILEPAGRDGFLARFLKAHGAGIHHVTFRVPSLADACARARAHGYDIVGYDDSDPEWKERSSIRSRRSGSSCSSPRRRGREAMAVPLAGHRRRDHEIPRRP